ncbi:MAG: serine/threonine protein kinase [Magnetococcales bacterium]|nr:serine/threonine protein kinase [Magnetococcales bacterium]
MPLPQTLGRWRLLTPEGQESRMGILRGVDPQDGRIVAIKTLPFYLREREERCARIARLRHETTMAARLSHPNIVKLIDHGEEGGIPYLVLDWYPGATLRDLITKGPRPGPIRALELLRQTLSGLEHIHASGLAHGDLKPANLLLTPEGDIRITDFGAARQLASCGEAPAPALVTGTHGYMPPEQLMGQKIDRRADLFAAGVILHELLFGRKPFTGADPWEITQQILTAAPIQPVPGDPHLPPPLIAVLQKALAKRPRDRFQSATEFLNSLHAATASTN